MEEEILVSERRMTIEEWHEKRNLQDALAKYKDAIKKKHQADLLSTSDREAELQRILFSALTVIEALLQAYDDNDEIAPYDVHNTRLDPIVITNARDFIANYRGKI